MGEREMRVKTCTKCKMTLPVSEYYAKKTGRDGLHTWCKSCTKAYKTDWWLKNKDEQSERIEKWRAENPDKVAGYQKKWSTNNPEKVREKSNRWRINNPEKFKEKERRAYEKRRVTVKGKLEDAIRAGFYRGIVKGSKTSRKTFDILGFTVDELRAHLERQFEPGMSWENYGAGGWEVDHIIPLAAHNYETPDDEDFKRAWSLKNLRPMWGHQNKRKSDKLTTPFQPSLLIATNDNRTIPCKEIA